MTTLVYTARCLGGAYPATACDWTAEGRGVQTAAERHAAETGHATLTEGRPA